MSNTDSAVLDPDTNQWQRRACVQCEFHHRPKRGADVCLHPKSAARYTTEQARDDRAMCSPLGRWWVDREAMDRACK